MWYIGASSPSGPPPLSDNIISPSFQSYSDIIGVLSDTKYKYQLISCDGDGNCGYAPQISVSTPIILTSPTPLVTPTSIPNTPTPTPTRTPTPTVAPSPTPTIQVGKTGDINGDNQVGIQDLSILLSNWGLTNPPNPKADINRDGTVGITDLSILLSNWGK